MNRDKLLALADRCEAATGPDRELDAEITMEIMASLGADMRGKKTPAEYLEAFPNLCLEYTASLDAAMSLLPEGHVWAVEGGPGDLNSGAWCYDRDVHNSGPSLAATPALALTAACLRALAGHRD